MTTSEYAENPQTPQVILTGNLAYIDSYASAVEAAGAAVKQVDIMRLEKTGTPGGLTQILEEQAIENIIFSRHEHVDMFLELLQEDDEKGGKLRGLLTGKLLLFSMDEKSFSRLDAAQLPVLRSPGPKSIDLVEYFLRLRRTGPVLAPCMDPEQEEAPEFLGELELAIHYFRLYDARPYEKQELEKRRQAFYALQQQHAAQPHPLHVLLHEPGTLTQFMVAFPDAQYVPEALHFIPLHEKTKARLAHLGLSHSDVLPWHPDRPGEFSKALEGVILNA